MTKPTVIKRLHCQPWGKRYRDIDVSQHTRTVMDGSKFILYRLLIQSDIPSVTLDVTLNGTEMSVLAILKEGWKVMVSRPATLHQ